MQTDAIRQEPTFADALGEFSSSFRSSLAQSGFTEPAYLARLDSVLLQEQLLQAVSLGGQFPDVLLDRIARYQLEKRTASWLVFLPKPRTSLRLLTPSLTLFIQSRNHHMMHPRCEVPR